MCGKGGYGHSKRVGWGACPLKCSAPTVGHAGCRRAGPASDRSCLCCLMGGAWHGRICHAAMAAKVRYPVPIQQQWEHTSAIAMPHLGHGGAVLPPSHAGSCVLSCGGSSSGVGLAQLQPCCVCKNLGRHIPPLPLNV